jgi:hypothetical protein
MKQQLRLLLVILLSFILHCGYSQGCSDAGFCTMGAMKPDQAFSKHINLKLKSVEMSYYKGVTPLTPIITVINLDVSVGFTEKTGFQVKVPYQTASGSFGNTSGLGDISMSLTHNFYESDNFDFNATVGVKIPTNKSDLASDASKVPNTEGAVFPMYYQTSLGSFDIVAGASLISKKWMFAAGYQQALTANNNTFDSLEWISDYPDPNYVKSYAEATLLKRGTDVMFRVERNFRFVKYNITLGLLPIIRITKDQIFDDALQAYVKVPETTGMALSALAGFGYNLNVNNTLKFTYGYKLKQRNVNPDGLTRDNVMILAYLFRF